MPPDISSLHGILNYNHETGKLTWKVSRGSKSAGSEAGTTHKRGYIRIRIFGRYYMAHVIAWAMYHGRWPTGMIDHRNGITGQNDIENLREASRQQNAHNSKPRSDSALGIKGVQLPKGAKSYRAVITNLKGKKIRIGGFKTAGLAKEFRDLLAEMMHGEYARHA